MSIDLDRLDNKLKEAKSYYSNGKLRRQHVINYDGKVLLSETYTSTGKLKDQVKADYLTPESFWYFRTNDPERYIIENYKSLGFDIKKEGEFLVSSKNDLTYVIKLFPDKIITNIFLDNELQRIISENDKKMLVKDKISSRYKAIEITDDESEFIEVSGRFLTRWKMVDNYLTNYESYYAEYDFTSLEDLMKNQKPYELFKLSEDKITIYQDRKEMIIHHVDCKVNLIEEFDSDGKLIHQISFGSEKGKSPTFNLNSLFVFSLDALLTFGNMLKEHKLPYSKTLFDMRK